MIRLQVDGIPLHAALVHFPIAAWTAATLLALAALAGGPGLASAAVASNIAGLLTGLAAIAAGAAEFVSLRLQPPARDAAARHMVLACGTWLAYLVMLLAQTGGLGRAAAGLGVAALLALVAAGHAGARLVFHHGVARHG